MKLVKFNFNKVSVMIALLSLTTSVMLTACGKDSTNNNTPPPAPITAGGTVVGSTSLPPPPNGAYAPPGNYCYGTQCGACPIGYVLSGNSCVMQSGFNGPCPAGSTWTGWSCAPSGFACQTGTFNYTYGGCTYPYSTGGSYGNCQYVYYSNGAQYCVSYYSVSNSYYRYCYFNGYGTVCQ